MLNMLPYSLDTLVFYGGILEKDLSQNSDYNSGRFRHASGMLLRAMIDDGERHCLNKRAFLHLTNPTTGLCRL